MDPGVTRGSSQLLCLLGHSAVFEHLIALGKQKGASSPTMNSHNDKNTFCLGVLWEDSQKTHIRVFLGCTKGSSGILGLLIRDSSSAPIFPSFSFNHLSISSPQWNGILKHLVRSFWGHKLCRRLIIGHTVDLRAGCDSMQCVCVCETERKREKEREIMHASMFNWVCSRGSNLSPSHRVLQQWLIQDQGKDGQGLHTQMHFSSPAHTTHSHTHSFSPPLSTQIHTVWSHSQKRSIHILMLAKLYN